MRGREKNLRGFTGRFIHNEDAACAPSARCSPEKKGNTASPQAGAGGLITETDYLFNLVEDGNQNRNPAAGMRATDTVQEQCMQGLMFRLMKQNDAPEEYFERLGFRL